MRALTEHPYYEILERCGQGGMGVVYRARDRRLNRIVALKFLIDEEHTSGSTGAVRRFQREAEAIAALNHPSIATIFEAGEWDGSPFLALEFLSGGTLRAKIREGPLSFGQTLDYAAHLTSGLAYAHSKAILHRDIKPGNCMFNEHGALKLVDFGLAKRLAAESITHDGGPVGTIAYMAPELLRGERASVRTDLYALGAVVYEMAAGQPLYAASGLSDLVQQVLYGSAVPLSERRPDLPAGFCATVDRATSPNPEARFATVQAFADELRGSRARMATDVELAPTKTFPPPRPPKPTLWRRWWFYASVLPVLCIVAWAAMYFPGGKSGSLEMMTVLPFENLGGDPANQALCDGLQETVASLLSSAKELRAGVMVVPSSEVRRSQVHTAADARKQFHTTLALTGAIQKSDRALQVTLDLIDARTSRQKNSRILTIPADETGSLQHELADSLGAMLGVGPLAGNGGNPGATTANSTAYDLFLRGRGALEDRNLETAADLLKKAVDADPQFALARAQLAEAYLRLNLSTKDPKWLGMADAEVAKAAEAGSSPEVMMSRALIQKATGNWQEAIRLFGAVLKIDPSNIEAYRLLADTWDSAGNPKEAERIYRRALAIRPGYWPLYENIGNFYSTHRQYDSAEKEFLTGLSLAPESATLYYNLGANYFRMSRWAEAGNAFEKSISIHPTAIGYANLCTVRFYEDQYADAAKQCEAATRLQPANPFNWGNLGDALWQLPAERQRASAAFETAANVARQQLAIKDENPVLHSNYALYLAKLGQKAEAFREARRAVAQAPKEGIVAFYAARVYAVAGDSDAALAAIKQSLALGVGALEIQREPDFNELRKDARYAQYLAGSQR